MTHRFAQNRRLQAKNAPRCKLLMLFPSSAVRPERTSRLLSCHRSVGGLLPAFPARPFAKLRSDKKSNQTPDSSFRASSLQSIRRIFGDRARHASPDRAKPSAGAAAAVLVVCRSGAGRRQADASRSDVVVSGVVDSGREIGRGNIDANDPELMFRPERYASELPPAKPTPWRSGGRRRMRYTDAGGMLSTVRPTRLALSPRRSRMGRGTGQRGP